MRTVREELTVLRARNIRREDFDADKARPKAGLTFLEYGTAYFNGKVDPDKRPGGVERERRSFATLNLFLAILPYRKLTEARSWNTGLNGQWSLLSEGGSQWPAQR
jgi:hypothetical protein